MSSPRSDHLQKKSAGIRRQSQTAPQAEPRQAALPGPAAGWRPADVARLQRAAGNRAVNRLVDELQAKRGQPGPTPQPPQVQAKLVVGAAGDAFEQEADANARAVVQRLNAPAVQAHAPEEAQGATRVQRSIGPQGGALEPGTEAALQGARGAGQALPDGTLKPMQQAFGADFSRVRVHTGDQADQLNRSLGARAFTTGQDIFFSQGAYAPQTTAGRELLAHELTHVVQQNAGLATRAQRFDEFALKSDAPGQVRRQPGDPVAPPKDASKGTHDLSLVAAMGDPAPKGWIVAGAPGPEYYAKADASAPSQWTLPVELQRGEVYNARFKIAIKELQRKLVMALGGRLSSGIWRRDGVFGASTEGAVKRFQKQAGLAVTGRADYTTWQALDKVAGARLGRVEYEWEEELTEFDIKLGDRPRFEWKKKDDVLNVAVNIKFDGNGLGAADTVRQNIRNLWNVFNIVYVKNKDGTKRSPRNPVIKLEFSPGGKAEPGDPLINPSAKVTLFKYPHPNAAARGHLGAGAKSRSDAGNWRVDAHPGDAGAGIPANDAASIRKMVGHEFGHLIGLEDEYSRRHKDIVRLTGEKATVRNDAAVKAALQANVDKLAKAIAQAKDLGDFNRINTWLGDWYAADASQLPIIARWYRKQTGAPVHQALKDAADRVAKATHDRIVGRVEGKMKARAQSLLEKRAMQALRAGAGAGVPNLERLRDLARKDALNQYKAKIEQAEKKAKALGEKNTAAAGLYAGFWESQLKGGYSTGGLMGDYTMMGKQAKDVRAGSPALEHEHGLQPRHVRRFAEFVMKYKPGEIWEVRRR
jgi:hypothetical protein